MENDLGTAETSTATKELSRSASAARMRQHRERRRKRMRCLTIELREREIEEFIRRKRLSPEDRNDPSALRRTVHQYLDDTLW